MADVVISLGFDDGAETGEFDISIGGTSLTTYTYSNTPNPEVAITAFISTSTISTEELISLLSDVNVFSNQILIRFDPPTLTSSLYKVEIEKKATTLCATIEIEGVLLTNVEWNSITGEATFQPRPANTLTWSNYLLWQSFFDRVLSEIEKF